MNFWIFSLVGSCFVLLVNCDVVRLLQIESAIFEIQQDVGQLKEQRSEDQQMFQEFLKLWKNHQQTNEKLKIKSRDRNNQWGDDEIQKSLAIVETENRALLQLETQIHNLEETLQKIADLKTEEKTELNEFRNDLSRTKEEMAKIRREIRISRAERSTNQQTTSENAAKSIGWLFSAVRELKQEFNELSKSINLTNMYSKMQQLENNQKFLQNDLATLRHQLTQDLATYDKQAAEVMEVIASSDKLQSQVQSITNEMTELRNSVAEMKNSSNLAKLAFPSRLRHLHAAADDVRNLNLSLIKVSASHGEFQTRMSQLENKTSSLEMNWKLNNETMAALQQSWDSKTSLLMEVMANYSVTWSSLQKFEAWQTSLQETFQLFQEEVDFELRDLRTSLQKLQSNSTHIHGVLETSIIKQQAQDEKLTKAVDEITKIKDDSERRHIDLAMLQNHVLNLTLQDCKSINNQLLQKSNIKAMEQQIAILSEHVKQLNSTVENFNSAFSVQTSFLESPLNGADGRQSHAATPENPTETSTQTSEVKKAKNKEEDSSSSEESSESS